MASTGKQKEVKMISELSNQVLLQYESLQREYEKIKNECKKMQEERDEALQKLKEFEQVSHRVIEEVNNIQENLEIEKTCRESVEALASKLNRQNRSLKRKSMLYMSHLGADVVAEISLDDDDEDPQEEESGVCSSSHCQIVIAELRDKLEVILAEKKQITIDLEMTREQLCQTRRELLKEKHDNTVLIAETFQQKKLLGKYNRVSQYALDEFEALREDLKLERDLRSEAEKFAHEVLVEQKKLKRQSQMLIQSVSPTEALQKALAEINTLTHTLETQKLEHQQQVKDLEEQIHSSELKKQLTALQRQTELLEEERKEWQHKHTNAETEAKDLRFTVEELKKKLQQVSNPPPAAPGPPPPPPPPPPLPAPSSNPLSSLLSILRKKKDVSTEIALVEKDSSEKTPEKDIRHQAVDEMMQRIKKGVQLRRVSQRTNRARPGPKEGTHLAIQELQGILNSVKRPGPSSLPGTRPPSPSPKSELEKALHRRRDALKAEKNNTNSSTVLDLPQIKQTQPEPGQNTRDQDTLQHTTTTVCTDQLKPS
ncbi:shootin-1 [Sinocyclocheilus grahami]|uniref:Shootin-1 n=1 Tax=Sinocyclocheilus grahami TaxID=75366 RepID=A0A672S599_SINGR|nr:PREDICTED: shootin-1 [Sinocyclocheilus grahami]XP_016090693.1 PREDICTED: shootin-1 [Sinocyclocheilus grahami]XP_016090703.1 PREDICTED: shootin-1 [Sinocyclocheilus grahami]XP_016090712.1 PREDICTED: shootin-1 [Sinocyclocheilus grahami]